MGEGFKRKPCTNCGKLFVFQHPNQRTCSPGCAEARSKDAGKYGKLGGRPRKSDKQDVKRSVILASGAKEDA